MIISLISRTFILLFCRRNSEIPKSFPVNRELTTEKLLVACVRIRHVIIVAEFCVAAVVPRNRDQRPELPYHATNLNTHTAWASGNFEIHHLYIEPSPQPFNFGSNHRHELSIPDISYLALNALQSTADLQLSSLTRAG